MTNNVFISVVISTFNRENYIGRTVQSIISQADVDLELIVVDDGSTDNTEQVIIGLNHPAIKYFRILNSERGSARNFGLNKSSGKYINYFDSDDLYLPCLEQLIDFIRKNNFPDVIYGAIQPVDQNGTLLKSQALPYQSFTKNLLFNNFLACGSVFIKREVADQFLFQEDRRLSSAEDWELWLRVHASFTFQKFPGSIFQQVHHQNRSLTTISPDKIEVRDNYFAELISKNENLKSFYGRGSLNLFVADRYTFIALAWCDSSAVNAFQYLSKALSVSFFVLTRKRFWAVLKNSLVRLFKNDKKSS